MTSNDIGQIMSIKNNVSDKNSVVELNKYFKDPIHTDKVYINLNYG